MTAYSMNNDNAYVVHTHTEYSWQTGPIHGTNVSIIKRHAPCIVYIMEEGHLLASFVSALLSWTNYSGW